MIVDTPLMLTEAGDKAVERLLVKIEAWCESGRVAEHLLPHVVMEQMRRVYDSGHAEVYAYAVEMHIVVKVNETCDAVGWNPITMSNLVLF